MKSQTDDLTQVLDALAALRQEVALLGDRVATLESTPAVAVKPTTAPAKAAAAPAPTRPEPLSEELAAVIGAAVAAFLGKRAHVRQINLVGSAAWAQQGRVTIQASHTLPVQHG